MNDTLTDSLIEYPCDFPLKVFGQQETGFAQSVADVIARLDPDFSAASIEMRTSRNARYISLTCTIRATSREQLDAVYMALNDHPAVVMVL